MSLLSDKADENDPETILKRPDNSSDQIFISSKIQGSSETDFGTNQE